MLQSVVQFQNSLLKIKCFTNKMAAVSNEMDWSPVEYTGGEEDSLIDTIFEMGPTIVILQILRYLNLKHLCYLVFRLNQKKNGCDLLHVLFRDGYRQDWLNIFVDNSCSLVNFCVDEEHQFMVFGRILVLSYKRQREIFRQILSESLEKIITEAWFLGDIKWAWKIIKSADLSMLGYPDICINKIVGTDRTKIADAQFSPTKKLLVYTTFDGLICVCKVSKKMKMKMIYSEQLISESPSEENIVGLQWSPCGTLFSAFVVHIPTHNRQWNGNNDLMFQMDCTNFNFRNPFIGAFSHDYDMDFCYKKLRLWSVKTTEEDHFSFTSLTGHFRSIFPHHQDNVLRLGTQIWTQNRQCLQLTTSIEEYPYFNIYDQFRPNVTINLYKISDDNQTYKSEIQLDNFRFLTRHHGPRVLAEPFQPLEFYNVCINPINSHLLHFIGWCPIKNHFHHRLYTMDIYKKYLLGFLEIPGLLHNITFDEFNGHIIGIFIDLINRPLTGKRLFLKNQKYYLMFALLHLLQNVEIALREKWKI